MTGSVRLSVRLSARHTFFTIFSSSYHHVIFRSYYQCKSDVHAKGQGQGQRRSQVSVTPVWIHIWWWNDELGYRVALFLAATKQLYKWYFPSVCPSVCPSVRLSVCPSVRHTFLTMFPSRIQEIFRSYYQWPTFHASIRGVKVTEVTPQLNRFRTVTPFTRWLMHIAWCCLEEVPYCSRSSVKFQGHTALKIVEFDLDWAFPDCNSSLNSPMATKWCTKLEVA